MAVPVPTACRVGRRSRHGHRRLDRQRAGLESSASASSVASDCSLESASASRRNSAARARAASARSSARTSSASASASESGASVVDGSASESVTGPGQSPAQVHRDARLVPGYTRRITLSLQSRWPGGCGDAQYAGPCHLYVIFSEEENFLIAHAKILPCASSWRWWLR
jgi:hypothetical protein